MSDDFSYRLFGLKLRSAIELPELIAVSSEDAPDVRVYSGKVESQEGAARTPQVTDCEIVIDIIGVARFAILNGTSIIVDPANGAPPRNVRLYLLGSAMGMLLHQRGLLPLHANAVENEGRAFAFMGPSGAGKSTLAAWFHDHGYRIVSDDVCVIRFGADGGDPSVSPGLPRLRLWREALVNSGRQAERFAASYSGDDSFDKFDVPITSSDSAGDALSLAAVYLLGVANERAIEPIRGAAAVEALMANTYRGEYSSLAGQAKAQYLSCVNIAARVPMFRFQRPLVFGSLNADIDALIDHARHLPS